MKFRCPTAKNLRARPRFESPRTFFDNPESDADGVLQRDDRTPRLIYYARSAVPLSAFIRKAFRRGVARSQTVA